MPVPPLASRSQDDVELRDYRPEDWPDVCRVHDAARVRELAAGGVDPRAFRTMEEAADRDEFFRSLTIVACTNEHGRERLAGFVSWNGDYITWLYVAPDRLRHGIGRRLLAAAIERIGPAAWTSLIAGNEPALALYRQAGLEVVRTRPADCEGFPCEGTRMALPTGPMRDPNTKRTQR